MNFSGNINVINKIYTTMKYYLFSQQNGKFLHRIEYHFQILWKAS